MAEEFKHGYIDDNPYIVYTDNPNTTYDEYMVMGGSQNLTPGGGQVDVGYTVDLYATTGDIIIGEQASLANYTFFGLLYGDSRYVYMNSLMGYCSIAANLTVEIEYPDATVDGFYVVSLDETDKFTSVEEVNVEYTLEDNILTFTVPDLSDDPDNSAYLFIKFATE